MKCIIFVIFVIKKLAFVLQQNKRALLQKLIDEREACAHLKARCNKFPIDKKPEGNDCKGILKSQNNSLVGTPT